jgi:hypothetical protein
VCSGCLLRGFPRLKVLFTWNLSLGGNLLELIHGVNDEVRIGRVFWLINLVMDSLHD